MEEHPDELFGIQGGEDELGVLSTTVPYLARSLEACKTVAKGRIVLGVPEKSRTWDAYQGSTFIVRVLYEGQEAPTNDPKLIRYSLRGNFEDEAIEANPQINELVEKYNGSWKDGRVIFPPTYIPESENSSGLGGGDDKEKKNPMCGVEKYKKLGVIWQRTYAAANIPGWILMRVGKTIDTPPGAPPELKGRTKWLVMEPDADERGNVAEITEKYLLLDEDEADGMYKKAAA